MSSHDEEMKRLQEYYEQPYDEDDCPVKNLPGGATVTLYYDNGLRFKSWFKTKGENK